MSGPLKGALDLLTGFVNNLPAGCMKDVILVAHQKYICSAFNKDVRLSPQDAVNSLFTPAMFDTGKVIPLYKMARAQFIDPIEKLCPGSMFLYMACLHAWLSDTFQKKDCFAICVSLARTYCLCTSATQASLVCSLLEESMPILFASTRSTKFNGVLKRLCDACSKMPKGSTTPEFSVFYDRIRHIHEVDKTALFHSCFDSALLYLFSLLVDDFASASNARL